MITVWNTPIAASVEQILRDLKLMLFAEGLLRDQNNTGSDVMVTCPFHKGGHERKHYYRYMDDVVIFASSKEELHEIHRKVTAYTRDYLHLNIKGNYQIFPTKVRGVDFVGYRFFGEYTLLRKSTAINFKRKMRACRKKMENNIPPTYSEWCSFNSYKGWLGNCDSYRLFKKYMEPLIEYMQNYYEREVKDHGEVYKCYVQCG